jgi:hypothetical protein
MRSVFNWKRNIDRSFFQFQLPNDGEGRIETLYGHFSTPASCYPYTDFLEKFRSPNFLICWISIESMSEIMSVKATEQYIRDVYGPEIFEIIGLQTMYNIFKG